MSQSKKKLPRKRRLAGNDFLTLKEIGKHVELFNKNQAMSLMDQLEDTLASLEARITKNIRRINSIMKV